MRVYFIRHGKTELSNTGVHQPKNVPLSPLGIKQAKCLAKRLKKLPIDLLISSPYPRALQTAEIINQELNAKLILEKLAQEYQRPSLIEGKSYADPLSIQVNDLINKNFHDPTWHHSDEDNFSDVVNRSKQLLQKLSQTKSQNIVVVSHGRFIRLLALMVLLDTHFDSQLYQAITSHFDDNHNTGITILDYKDGRWFLITWNDHAHLGSLPPR